MPCDIYWHTTHSLLYPPEKFCIYNCCPRAIVLHKEMVSQSECRSPPPDEGLYGLIFSVFYYSYIHHFHLVSSGGHGCRVVTLLPPTSKAGLRLPAQPQVGKLVVACRWSAVYSTEP